jgi:predicted metal-dependent hydrolase
VREEEVFTLDLKDIGKVTFIRKTSLKNLKIIIKPFKGVMVYIPRMISSERARRFVEEKSDWIKKGQQKFKKFEKGITVFNENTSFQTRNHTLNLCRHAKPTIKTTIGGNMIQVVFPQFADILDQRIQGAIRKAIVQTWRIEAREYLVDRTKELASNWDLSFSRLTVRDNKTRWGSCSRKNNINLNIHLMRLPNHLSDYVILHELSHTIHKHHQKEFWTFLNTLTQGKAKMLDKELNNYAPEIW